MPSTAALASAVLLSLAPLAARAQVTATGTNGPTNPPAPTLGSYNQTSDSRLATLNSVDDFCLFAPAEPNSEIGNVEGEVVAWCTKPRNGARLIPDGTITSAHFVKTDLYVQIQGNGDMTKLNIADGDFGGELDPHGATGEGNPVGGNVTSNVGGSDVFYEEWMQYISSVDFCMRICTAENETYSAAVECQHTFDLMGCNWVMPGDYTDNSFTTCDGDAAYPPGVYPVGEAGSGTTSTFQQLYTGTADGAAYTIGFSSTPQAAFSTPATSNCQTVSTISNGVTELASTAAATNAAVASGSAAGSAAGSGGSSAAAASKTNAAAAGSSGASAASSAGGSSGANARWVLNRETEVFVAAMGALLAGGLGAGAVLL